ncbi:ABC transporter ATP-binding protein [Jatrophihabitans telluris]|uniref:ABC transporter ATP-binding protein n=1 Tax=Jatrophihabitans telluris TaxID=2038343 RepID=A0ABY4R276_9ACTN|nr:ABC transporter ATP-binding protein [Jatrophihabitans telluris]UQX89830.1 ABC transporter ATP-binding protein [Jatrophihabitans telluris]
MTVASQPPASGHELAPEGRIVIDNLTKVFGQQRAVDQLSFTVEPGSVTGFLGPNGAGKTTTLRMLLGLIAPTSGVATINGVSYHELPLPLQTVGAALEASSFHPAHTGRQHLQIYAAAAGLPSRRADEVLDIVGLSGAATKKTKGYSMGMRQRLGLAATLLGDPRVLILDEPANGLDPEGIRWLRGFFRHLASEGRTVLVSSHQLAEIQEVADRAVILNRGRLVRAGTLAELSRGTSTAIVRGPDLAPLQQALAGAGFTGSTDPDGSMRVRADELTHIGHLAFINNVELHELSLEAFDLEKLFFTLTEGAHQGQQFDGVDTRAAASGGQHPGASTGDLR